MPESIVITLGNALLEDGTYRGEWQGCEVRSPSWPEVVIGTGHGPRGVLPVEIAVRDGVVTVTVVEDAS